MMIRYVLRAINDRGVVLEEEFSAAHTHGGISYLYEHFVKEHQNDGTVRIVLDVALPLKENTDG